MEACTVKISSMSLRKCQSASITLWTAEWLSALGGMASARERTRSTSASSLRASIKYKSGNGIFSGVSMPESFLYPAQRRLGDRPDILSGAQVSYPVHILVDVIICGRGWLLPRVLSTLRCWALRRCEAADDPTRNSPASDSEPTLHAWARADAKRPALFALPAVRRGLQRNHSGGAKGALGKMSVLECGVCSRKDWEIGVSRIRGLWICLECQFARGKRPLGPRIFFSKKKIIGHKCLTFS